ncbi:MAG: quinol:electron acceptor oxidoreductase subunit ActD [Acidobacteriota bacterium]
MSAVYALYADPESAQAAVDRLRAAGVADREITVISSEPFESHRFGSRDKATWMFWLAGTGGAVGLAFAYWLTQMTERAWPLPTGGMRIVATWPNLIIMFEVTMLFAVLSTVATLLVTAQMPRRRPKLYDLAVSDGRILVGLDNPTAPLDALERALTVHGGQLKTLS